MIDLVRENAPAAETIIVAGVGDVAAWRVGVTQDGARPVWIAETRPRSIWFTMSEEDPRAIAEGDPDNLLESLSKAGERVFGERWIDTLTSIAGLGARSIDKWFQRGEIPPPRIVAWMAWLAASNPPEGVGAALALLRSCDNPEVALTFARKFAEHIDQPRNSIQGGTNR